MVLWPGPELAVHREGAGELRTSVYTEVVEWWNVRAELKSEYITHKAKEEEGLGTWVAPQMESNDQFFNNLTTFTTSLTRTS